MNELNLLIFQSDWRELLEYAVREINDDFVCVVEILVPKGFHELIEWAMNNCMKREINAIRVI